MIEHTVGGHVFPNFGHGVADGLIRLKQVVMLLRVPLVEGGQLMRDGREEPHDDADWDILHLLTEFLCDGGVLLRLGGCSVQPSVNTPWERKTFKARCVNKEEKEEEKGRGGARRKLTGMR